MSDQQNRHSSDDVLIAAEQQESLESRQWLAIFNAIADAVCLMDAEGRIMRLNDAFMKVTGKSEGELIGYHCWEIMHGTEGVIDKCPTLRALKSHQRENLALEVGGKWFDITVDPILDEAGKVVSFVHIMRDITGRRQDENRINKLSRIYRVMSGINQAITRNSDPQLFFNDACRIAIDNGGFRMAWIGLLDETTGKVEPVAHAGEVGNYLEKIDIQLFGESTEYGPTAITLLTGKHTICNDIEHDPRMAPWRDDAMRLGYRASAALPLTVGERVLGTFNLYAEDPGFFDVDEEALLVRLAADISFALEVAELELQRRRANESLAASTERLMTVMDSINALIYVADLETYEILFVNEYGRNIWGDIVGKTCWKTLQEGQSAPCPFCTNDKLLNTDGTPNGVYIWEFRNTVTGCWYDCRDQAIRWSDGRLVRMEIATDITAQRALEEQLHHSQKMESIGTLAGGIAHDFNNILTAIIGYAEIILLKMPKADPLHNYVTQIRAASDRAAHLTKDLLLFSRKQTSERRTIDLNESIRKVEVFLKRIIRADITYQTNLYNEALLLFADSYQLEQILINLATNACDAMPGGGTLTVVTELVDLDEAFVKANCNGKPGRYASITVSDTGHGMDEKTRLRIFEPFFTTKEVGKGTGLGLAVVYGIIKQHDGFVKVSSEAGKGTTFRIYLPLSDAETIDAAAISPLKLPIYGSETILLAEDDKTLRELTTSVLEEYGYTVIAAVDGVEAVRKFTGNADKIDLVMLDIIMPNMKGNEALDEIRKIRPAVNAIYISGYTADTFHGKASFDVDVPILIKPMTPTELLLAVRRQLSLKMVTAQ